MTAREIRLILNQTKNYRQTSYGQFDQETRIQPQETKDAAEALEFLIECLLQTMKVEIPEDYEKELWRQNNSGI